MAYRQAPHCKGIYFLLAVFESIHFSQGKCPLNLGWQDWTLTAANLKPWQNEEQIFLLRCGIRFTHSDAFHGLNNTRLLTLMNNRLEWIEDGLLQPLEHLNVLSLQENDIRAITNVTFNNLTRLTHLILTGNQLENIPTDAFKMLSALNTLRLSKNRLSSLDENLFYSGIPQLRFLDLSHNNITVIASKTFTELSNLASLILNGNSLANVNNVFNDLKKLSSLHLSHNKISEIEMKTLSNVEILNLSNNDIHTLTLEAMKSFPNIKSLTMKETKTEIIADNSFCQLKLEHVSLDGNKLSSIDDIFICPSLSGMTLLHVSNSEIRSLGKMPFRHLTNLILLSLNGNKLTNLTGRVFRGLESLTKLELQDNSIVYIDEDVFMDVKHLHSLNLKGNCINEILVNTFGGINQIRNVDLRENPISFIADNASLNSKSLDLAIQLSNFVPRSSPFIEKANYLTIRANLGGVHLSESFLSRMVFSTRLFISSCNISYLADSPFMHLSRLFTLDMSGNALTRITKNAFVGLKRVTVLLLSNNNIEQIENGSFRHMTSLKNLQIDLNNIHTVTVDTFRFHSNIISLNLASNNIRTVDKSSFEGLDHLASLELKNNPLNKVSAGVFDNLWRLSSLSLSNMSIAKIPPSSFHHLKKLRYLDLSENKLSELNNKVFDAVESLISLNLSHNSIYKIDEYALDSLPALERIDLRNNQLQTVPAFALNKLFSRIHPLYKFKITNNPLHCNCLFERLQEWVFRQDPRDNYTADMDHYDVPTCTSPVHTNGQSMETFLSLNLTCQRPSVPVITKTFGISTVAITCRSYGDPAPILFIHAHGKEEMFRPQSEASVLVNEATRTLPKNSSNTEPYRCLAVNIVGYNVTSLDATRSGLEITTKTTTTRVIGDTVGIKPVVVYSIGAVFGFVLTLGVCLLIVWILKTKCLKKMAPVLNASRDTEQQESRL